MNTTLRQERLCIGWNDKTSEVWTTYPNNSDTEQSPPGQTMLVIYVHIYVPLLYHWSISTSLLSILTLQTCPNISGKFTNTLWSLWNDFDCLHVEKKIQEWDILYKWLPFTQVSYPNCCQISGFKCDVQKKYSHTGHQVQFDALNI